MVIVGCDIRNDMDIVILQSNNTRLVVTVRVAADDTERPRRVHVLLLLLPLVVGGNAAAVEVMTVRVVLRGR